MNKRLTVKNEFGNVVYCVLSGAEPYQQQLIEVLSVNAGYGLTVDFDEESVAVRDYRTNETLGTFKVLSFEDTDEEIRLNWQEI